MRFEQRKFRLSTFLHQIFIIEAFTDIATSRINDQFQVHCADRKSISLAAKVCSLPSSGSLKLYWKAEPLFSRRREGGFQSPHWRHATVDLQTNPNQNQATFELCLSKLGCGPVHHLLGTQPARLHLYNFNSLLAVSFVRPAEG